MTADAASVGVGVVVGLVSHNDAETVSAVSHAIRTALHPLDAKTYRIVWVDTSSTDSTVERGRQAFAGCTVAEIVSPTTTADLLQIPYHRIPGKARALRAILTTASELDAHACVVLDAGSRTVEPQAIEQLMSPVLSHGFDFILAYYHRSPHDGALTKGLVYPLVRALYGVRLRQPAAAEFACSRRLLRRFLDEDLWDSETAQIGIDLWLTASATSGGFRLGEAILGPQPTRAEAGLDLATTVTQVVGSLFADLEDRAARWHRVRASAPVQQFGDPSPVRWPHSPPVRADRFIESYRLGYRELRDIWTWVLPPRTIVDLGKLVDARLDGFSFPDELWARIIYDFAVGYRMRVLPRDHLLRSLVPLYLGWLASFIGQTDGWEPPAVDERLERLAETFEAQKPYFIARWRWPERFRI